jgi:hypothetical protein
MSSRSGCRMIHRKIILANLGEDIEFLKPQSRSLMNHISRWNSNYLWMASWIDIFQKAQQWAQRFLKKDILDPQSPRLMSHLYSTSILNHTCTEYTLIVLKESLVAHRSSAHRSSACVQMKILSFNLWTTIIRDTLTAGIELVFEPSVTGWKIKTRLQRNIPEFV